MVRIAGVTLKDRAHIVRGLTAVYGIGLSSSETICKTLSIPTDKKVKDLTPDEQNAIRVEIDKNPIYVTEGDLRRKTKEDIQRLGNILSYRGKRHKLGLPVRGQSTKNNAKTARKQTHTKGKN